MVIDDDGLQILIDNYDDIMLRVKIVVGKILRDLVFNDVFNGKGQATIDTDPLNPRGINPEWAELSPITVRLKKNAAQGILIDEGLLRNKISWIIENTDWGDPMLVAKIGWFEDSGNLPYIAAIHEFGLTGRTFNTPEGQIMGGEPIGRTPQARQSIRSWYYRRLGILLPEPFKIVIPERSMLRKAMDMFIPVADDVVMDTILNELIRIIQQGA